MDSMDVETPVHPVMRALSFMELFGARDRKLGIYNVQTWSSNDFCLYKALG